MVTIKRQKTAVIFLILAAFWFSGLTAQENQIKLKVVAEMANIRDKGDIGSTIIFQALQGAVFTSLGKEGEWFHIEYVQDTGETLIGFVHESLVFEIKPPLSEKQKEEKQKEEEVAALEEIKSRKTITSEPKALPSDTAAIPPFSISFSGGGNYLVGGDINKGAEGWIDFNLETPAGESQQNFSPVHLSYVFGGELSFPLSRTLSLGIGADYFFGEKESSFSGVSPVTSLSVRPKIQALPLRLFLLCSILPQVYVKSGIEYAMTKCSYFYHSQEGEAWKEWKGNASSQDLGIMAGLGYLFAIDSNISIFMEASGRMAKLRNFTGTHTYQDSEGQEYTEEGSLYIFQGHTSEETAYPLLFIREKKPTEAGVSNPKKATINFSGFSLKIGIKFKF